MLDKPHTPETFPAPDWAPDRWRTVRRDYTLADVVKLKGSLSIRHTLAENGARRLWELLQKEDYLPTLGTFTGNQATQQVKAGLKAIYLSGWQVAADANTSGNMYPDQSLYPADSVPAIVRRINKALQRADQIQTMERFEGKSEADIDYFVPIIADAEAGFGGALNVFELMKAMIEAGAAAVHFEDQLASEKKCGHLGGKVLVPTRTFVRTLNAARLAADVMDVPTLIMARTDAEAAQLITSDIDEYDAPFITGERTEEGFYRLRGGFEAAIARGLAYAPYADLIWCETSTPSLEDARRFAEAIRKEHPHQMLAYNCSPSFNWAKYMGESEMEAFQRELGAMGYKYQFITLAGFHNLSLTTFNLARGYKARGMAAYSELQQAEFAAEPHGFSATRHQREVGTGYFDAVATAISQGKAATTAMSGSTETAQFH
ncbi:isocitrate lyase [Pelagibacterium sediminicola]|uniref:isocitrate lyase n=1 Tax=Pelagibacterium sediminicola TaxID=2248761 RepID=UPI000E30ED4B|nr:isocitrate lyase [Pelagibacterium sediminicola]